MLLEFRVKNFKSFLDEMTFKMTPAPKQKDLEYSILKQKLGKKIYKGLCSAVIYGPNASGKTNIIAAMDVMKSIVMKGNIKNTDDAHSPNISACKLELIPNNTLDVSKPTTFYIRFIEDDLLIEYEMSLDLGVFLDGNYDRKIIKEKLSVNEKIIFIRTNDIEFFDMKVIKDYLIDEFENNENSAKILAKNNLNPTELFLTNGFKAMFSSQLVNNIISWFENKFLVIYRADVIKLNKIVPDSKTKTVYIEYTTNEAAKKFGINSNALGYIVPEGENKQRLCSIFKDQHTAIPAELFESYGTVRFINMFPLILQSLKKGAILVLDEFDANIHPMALTNIINIFHDDDINKNNAQLIFNTHNPIFLNSNLFRRDEIKFVERDEKTHLSTHYALSDFKTSGNKGVRKVEDYMKHYFLGRYGAIKEIDFYDLFDKVINDKTREEFNDE